MLSTMISGNHRPWGHLSAACLALALFAGCGSSSDADEPAAKDEPSAAKTTEAPSGFTAKQLADALPPDSAFPKGSVVRVRCPGDPECDNTAIETQDASVDVAPALPAGVKFDSTYLDDDKKFRVVGGEWTEAFKLRAWAYDDAAAAAGDVASGKKEAKKLAGPVNQPAEKTDSGYDYGYQGKGTYDTLSINGWSGYLRVLDVSYVHLDGRLTDERYDIFVAVHKDNAFARVDSSFTVQGRNQAGAVKLVRGVLDDYLGKL